MDSPAPTIKPEQSSDSSDEESREPNQTPQHDHFKAGLQFNSKPERKKFSLFSRKALILLVILVLLGVAYYAGKTHKKDSTSTGKSTDSSLYYGREGYNPKDYQPAIGDPAVLIMHTTTKPIFASGKTAVIPACGVVTLENLAAQKLYIGSNSESKTVQRTYIDGVGKAPLDPNVSTLPTSTDDNHCMYIPEKSDSMIVIDVWQPPMTAPGAVQDEITRRYAPASASNLQGFELFKLKDDRAGESTYILRKGDIAVGMMLRLGSDEAAKNKLLATAGQNLADMQISQIGTAVAEYSSPTFAKTVVKACDLITNDDIKQLTGSDASQYAAESLSTATGVVKAPDNQQYNYIQNECSRANSGLGSGIGSSATFNQKLDVVAVSYQANAGARQHVEAIGKQLKNEVSAQIGEGGFGYKDTAGQNTVIFYQGRFVIELVLNRTLQQRGGLDDTSTMTKKLTPYAQAVAHRLQSLQ